MTDGSHADSGALSGQQLGPCLARLLLTPIPLPLLQPLLRRAARMAADAHPQVFARLGPAAGRRFLIDAEELPFVFVLVPTAGAVKLEAHRRDQAPAHDARIAGAFGDLFDMVDGALDGDALFFARTLHVTGDTDAVVRLRNALDDLDGSVLDSMPAALGPLSGLGALALAVVRGLRDWGRA
jgi:O2-independent ubiquinone biosynthesis accessory factor UbiT